MYTQELLEERGREQHVVEPRASLLKTSLHTQVADILARRIACGDLLPGDRLPDVEQLRAEFRVSRTVVREAIKLLTAKGLIASRQRVGITVSPRDQWSLLDPEVMMWRVEAGLDALLFQDLIGVRNVLEPGSVELAALVATDEEREQLLHLYYALEQTVDSPDAFIRSDVRFHRALLAASHNELLQHLSQTIGIAILAIASATTRLPGSSRASLPVHRAVVDAIRRRDPEAARIEMRRLVDEASRELARFLAQPESHPARAEALDRASREVNYLMTLDYS